MFLFFISVPGFTETTQLSVKLEDRSITISAAFLGDKPDAVLTSVREGLKSEVIFELRIYQRQRGFFSFLGDRLIFEKQICRVAHFDIFEDRYVIVSPLSGEKKYSEKGEFLENFFQLTNFKFKKLNELTGNISEYYILARIRVNPVLLVPPLNIITLFSSKAIVTPWAEADIPISKGSVF